MHISICAPTVYSDIFHIFPGAQPWSQHTQTSSAITDCAWPPHWPVAIKSETVDTECCSADTNAGVDANVEVTSADEMDIIIDSTISKYS